MSLLTPEFGLVFWMLVIFLIVLFILGKWGWPVISKSIAERNQYIEDSIVSAKEANVKLESVKAETNKLIAEARAQQNQILHDANGIKDQIISDAKKQAEVEANKIIENAKVTIQSEKDNALKEIKLQVIQLSVQLSEKVIKREFEDKKNQESFINEQLDELNAINS